MGSGESLEWDQAAEQVGVGSGESETERGIRREQKDQVGVSGIRWGHK